MAKKKDVPFGVLVIGVRVNNNNFKSINLFMQSGDFTDFEGFFFQG